MLLCLKEAYNEHVQKLLSNMPRITIHKIWKHQWNEIVLRCDMRCLRYGPFTNFLARLTALTAHDHEDRDEGSDGLLSNDIL